MVKCNGCANLESVIDGVGELTHIKHNCKKHKAELKLTSKMFKDNILPCGECNGKDYIKKEGINLGKL